MKKICVVFLMIIFAEGMISAKFTPKMVVKIHYADRDQAYKKLKSLKLTYEDVQKTWARALIVPEKLEEIRQ